MRDEEKEAARLERATRDLSPAARLLATLRSAVGLLSPAEEEAMLRRLRSITALTAPAEGAPADLTAIAEAIVRIGEFGADQRELISGASIGRILCAGRNVMVLEAMVTRS